MFYKYNVGENVNTNSGSILLLKQTIKVVGKDKRRVKAYLYKCNVCGYSTEILESNLLHGQGCVVCGKSRVISGYNDIKTTHPDQIKYFWNPKDAEKYSIFSNKKTDFKCQICGTCIKDKIIYSQMKNPPLCPKCKNTTSYPERFMLSVLKNAGIAFQYQKGFRWSQKRLYDFVIEDLKLIIETHGAQHYTKVFPNCESVEICQQNDYKKRQLANENGYTYLAIDCSKSNFDYIKTQLYNSELNKFISLDDIEWSKVKENALKPLWKKASEIWNSGVKNTVEIAKELMVNPRTVSKYLKYCSEIGLCNYDPKREMVKPSEKRGNPIKVICLNNLLIFNKIKEASIWCNGNRHIHQCCKGARNKAGRHPETGEWLKWMYLDDYFAEHPEITDKKHFISEHLFRTN